MPDFKPYKVYDNGQCLLSKLPESVLAYWRQLESQGWKIYVVNQNRGMCYNAHRVITVPKWAVDSWKIGYAIYYAAHEMAHAFLPFCANHGDKFMDKLIEICPPEFVHHELGYKPRNAARAGISKPNDF